MPNADELGAQLSRIEHHVDRIAEQLGTLRAEIAKSLAGSGPIALPELLELRAGHRLLVVGDAWTDLQLPAEIELHTIGTNAPLDALLEGAPYDAALIVDPTRTVASDWIRHTRPGGLIGCVYDPTACAGQPVLLRHRGREATGNFLASECVPLQARMPDPAGLPPASFEPSGQARHSRTGLPLYPWQQPVPWFLATCTIGEGLRLARISDGGLLIKAKHGSRCRLTQHGDDRHVVEDGPHNLFGHIARAHEQWRSASRPDWTRIRLTVAGDQHRVTIDGYPSTWLLAD